MRPARLAVLAVLLISSASVHADDAVPIHPALHDRFWFSAGVYVPKTTTSTQLDSTSLGVGTNIDLEHMLGMTTQRGVPDLFARWRFADRWRLEVAYFELNRRGTRVIDQDIHWGDQDFPIGAEIQSKLNFSDLRTSVGYSIFKRPDKEVGVGLGVHLASYDAALSVAGTGVVVGAGSGSEERKVLAPLPVVSAYGQFALTEEWAINVRIDRFYVSYDNYYGNITAAGIDLQYQPFRHLGFGLAYRSLFIDFTATRPDWTLKFEQNFQGPLFYVNASF